MHTRLKPAQVNMPEMERFVPVRVELDDGDRFCIIALVKQQEFNRRSAICKYREVDAVLIGNRSQGMGTPWFYLIRGCRLLRLHSNSSHLFFSCKRLANRLFSRLEFLVDLRDQEI